MTFVQRRLPRVAGAALAAALTAMLAGSFPAGAQAARVLVMGPGGHVTARQDPFVPPRAPAVTPAPASAPAAHAAKARKKPPQKTVASELGRLRNSAAITPAEYNTYNADWGAALAAERRLRGTRQRELDAVTENLHNIAAAGKLTPGRLPVLFETLDRNREWWTTGPLLSSGQYVEFSDSDLVWEYYGGQGIELQVLATFGKADGMYAAGPADYPQMEALLAQMIPLAVNRAGGLAWEYYFQFDGGQPPWTSAMSQGTGIEALTRAYLAFHNANYLQLAHRLCRSSPPRHRSGAGGHAARRPLRAVHVHAGDLDHQRVPPVADRALRLRAGQQRPAGPAAVRRRQRRGAGGGAPVRHRRLVAVPARGRGHAQLPRARDGIPPAAVHPHAGAGLLHHRPALHRLPDDAARAPAAHPNRAQGQDASISFRLSKVSRVGIVVVGPGGNTLFSTSANFGYGTRSFTVRRSSTRAHTRSASPRPTSPATSTGSWGRSRSREGRYK